MKKLLATLAVSLTFTAASAQSKLYPQHFDLQEVTLLDGPMKNAMVLNDAHLLSYDADRLMAPFIRQAGLDKVKGTVYEGWLDRHPSFKNWGLSDWSLEGHVGGHYISALALAYAASRDYEMRAQLLSRMNYCLEIMADCQRMYDNNTEGLRGFIGGQPINQVWTGLYANDTKEFRKYGGWVPFYCQHKVLAGLRDAYVYAGSELAKECFRKMADWSCDVISNLDDVELQSILGWEHGGMNEPLADAYHIFGDKKYLYAAVRYSQRQMIDGMQGTIDSYDRNFLSGKHANTQVPKYIGFERIAQLMGDNEEYFTASTNFWDDVANHRTVAIGGNSMSEHFVSHDHGNRYMDDSDGPESCNTNNMLKFSESLFDCTHDSRYADFYELAMWNHIMSTQDPKTGGYVYFTTLRPQGYRIYSQPNQGMWCCVGTGMENHSKYGHFIYTHSEKSDTLFVNLFTASELNSQKFGLKQETKFPYEQQSILKITKKGNFSLAIRKPSWVAEGYGIKVNNENVQYTMKNGYAIIKRAFKKGDVITVSLPMQLRVEECPDLKEYVAFKYGPILLAAKTTAESEDEAWKTDLEYEKLRNEYGGEGRMDHAPGSRGTSKSLLSAAKIIGVRSSVPYRVKIKDITKLQFTLTADAPSEDGLSVTPTIQLLQPFYEIHHARYQCYWYQNTAEEYAKSDMIRKAELEKLMEMRTIDFVAAGEQQSEAGHEAKYSGGSTHGNYRGESYRDTKANEFIQYALATNGETNDISLMCRFITSDRGRKATITIDGTEIGSIEVRGREPEADSQGFFNVEYPIPASLLKGKKSVTFRISASSTTMCPGLYHVRLMRKAQ